MEEASAGGKKFKGFPMFFHIQSKNSLNDWCEAAFLSLSYPMMVV
jgi:hypothetical protein